MRAFVKPILLFLAMTSLAACTSLSGTRSGSVASGSVLTALGDGLLGSSANQMTGSDKRLALEAEYKALEYSPKGKVVTWTGSGSVSGEVTAAQPYQVGSQNCRQYTHILEINSAPQIMRGTACRNSDGSWTPLN